MGNESKKIKIDNVQGGDPQDQNALKRNYFLPTGSNDTYQFFDPGDDLIVTDPPVLASGYNFSFSLREMPGVTWTISNFAISNETATGNWTNTHNADEDEGEFHAQSGGGLEESTSSATAG